MSPRRSPPTVITPRSQAGPLADVDAIIGALEAHRQSEPDRQLRETYRAAIDRLHALAYWLQRAGPAVATPPQPPPEPPPPAAAMPAATPRAAVVVARKRRR